MIKRLFSATIKTTKDKTVQCPNQLLINGQWVDAANSKTISTFDPATGLELTKVAAAGAKDVDLAA